MGIARGFSTELEIADNLAKTDYLFSDFIPGLSFSGLFALFGVRNFERASERGTGERREMQRGAEK